MAAGPRYWFPAKRYGWGWGPPATWEGWAVMAAFVVVLVIGGFIFPPATAMADFIALVVILSVALAAVCWLKGEPPRWRWGDK